MSESVEVYRQQLAEVGWSLKEQDYDRALALKAPMEARGVNFGKLISAVKKWGPVVLGIMEEVFKEDAPSS